jgi:hypothetical protein
MATIISSSIDLSKIDKTKIVQGKNGGQYYNVTINLYDTTDNYGNNASITEAQSKEQRDAKEPKKYLGNGKVNWTDGKVSVATKLVAANNNNEAAQNNIDDLPF